LQVFLVYVQNRCFSIQEKQTDIGTNVETIVKLVNHLNDKLEITSSPPPSTPKIQNEAGQIVAPEGYWRGIEAAKYHHHDDSLANAILQFLQREKANITHQYINNVF
jgi:hypothetical protein